MPTVKSITPHLVVQEAAKALEFYQQAFGATVVSSMPTPDGRIMHAQLDLGGHPIYVVDEFPEHRAEGGMMAAPPTLKGSAVSLALEVDDADAVYERAVRAGATAHEPLADMFWGARYGQVLDPYGHLWEISQQVTMRTPEEIQAAMGTEKGRTRN